MFHVVSCEDSMLSVYVVISINSSYPPSGRSCLQNTDSQMETVILMLTYIYLLS